MSPEEHHLNIPGLEPLEPLEPFYDDLFGGLDEHPAGPWAHHTLEPPEHQDHFPAIDCCLLDGHAHSGPAAAGTVQEVAVLQHSAAATVLPQEVSTQQVSAAHTNSQQTQHASASLVPAVAVQPAGAAELHSEPFSLGSSSLHCSAALDGNSCNEEVQQLLLVEQGPSLPAKDGNSSVAAVCGPACCSSTTATDADTTAVAAGTSCAEECTTTIASDTAATAVAATATAGEADAAAAGAVAPEQEPSSGSLPDIDDVPEQSAADMTQLPQQTAGQQEQEEQVQQNGQQQVVKGAADTAQEAAAQQVEGSTIAAADVTAQDSPATQAHTATAAAGGASSDVASADSTQPLSVDPEDFASPVTSWHSCMTSASKTSSMSSCRGFFLPVPAVAAAGAASGAAAVVASSAAAASAADGEAAAVSATQGDADAAGSAACNKVSDGHVQQQPQQQQQPARSGACSPAMVSSLHLALQEQQQQQQQQSQHSDTLAATPAVIDPLSASSCHADAADAAAAVAAATVVPVDACGVDNAAGGAADGDVAAHNTAALAKSMDLSSSQPIAVQRPQEQSHCHQQQQQQQSGQRGEEELWQSVSPPSFSSSPGLMVSAAAAKAAAAAAGGAAAAGDGQEANEAGTTGGTGAADAAGAEAGPSADEAAADVDDDGEDVGHGHFYADAAAGLSESPEDLHLGQQQELEDMLAGLHVSQQQQQGLLPPQLHHQHQHLAASSYMLRQSELVDLSLSTSVMHPAQLQQAQMLHPGWLTAHQQLPPAAAQAVERAVVALDDSVCYQGRANSPSELLGVAAGTAGAGSSSSGVRGGAVGSVSGSIRRSAAGQQWNRAHTQPQQDQQARHRVAHAAHNGPGGPFGWPGAAVLGDWFSSTLQQPLAAAASRAAAGVGQRLGMTHGQQQQRQDALRRQHSGTASAGRALGHGTAVGGGISSSSSGPAGPAAADATAAAATSAAAAAAEAFGADSDAVLVEKTADLPQSLQEQEDEAFRGLLFLGGRDSQGRPVVVVNTDAIPTGHNAAPRDAALAYLLKRLSPIVSHGPYVLVIVALHNGPQFRLLPGVWCVRAYQSLPRAFRKNVKHVLLLQPSMLVKAAVALLYPFVSSKAHAKVKQVQRLLDIDVATRGEVQVPHLGEAFLTTLHYMNSRVREAESSAYD